MARLLKLGWAPMFDGDLGPSALEPWHDSPGRSWRAGTRISFCIGFQGRGLRGTVSAPKHGRSPLPHCSTLAGRRRLKIGGNRKGWLIEIGCRALRRVSRTCRIWFATDLPQKKKKNGGSGDPAVNCSRNAEFQSARQVACQARRSRLPNPLPFW